MCKSESVAKALDDLLSGSTLRIIAGKEKEILHVHIRALRAWKSPKWDALLNEGEESQVDLDMSDIDIQIVRRFLSYVHPRDYDTPLPRLRSAIEEASSSRATEVSATEKRFALDSDSRQHNRPQSSVKILFQTVEEPCRTMTRRLNLHVKRGDRYDFEAALLAHADMYFFALSYDLAGLREAVLCRLAVVLTLIKNTLDIKNSGVLSFIREVYKNSRATDGEDIKNLVSSFAASNYTQLMGKDLEGLATENGDFARDLLRKLNTRIQAIEREGWCEVDP